MERICDLTNLAVGVKFSPSLQANPPPLVPVERIRKGLNICPHRLNGCYLLQLDETTMLKVGVGVQMGEAEAMILVKNQTSVPVPQVFNAYLIEDIGFILMEKIDGIQLGQSWPELPRTLKESFAQELRGYIQQWRQIKGSFFGTVDNGPCRESVFQHPWENKVYHYGPFTSRKDFNKGMVEALANSRPNQKLETEQDKLFAEELLMSGIDQEEVKVLTHGDLDQSNIMVRDGKITGIIDWGAAGYSVPEREYYALRWPALDSDWRELSTSILPPDGYDYWYNINRQMMLYTCI
jgi:aminoglycoside phosphotransferase